MRQGETRGHKGRQDPREGGHPTKGNKKGHKGRQKGREDPREGGHTIQQRETRRGTGGEKGRQDPREGGHTIQREDKGRQGETRPLGEGGHTIDYQGRHLKKALRTPNSKLFGGKPFERSELHFSHVLILV